MQQPLIILCPLRSFSSVACAMLGQHPQTYGLPEVNLFIADRLEGIIRAHRTRPHAMHGLLRTLAQLHDGEQTVDSIDAARAWMDEHSHWTAKRVFDHILELVDPKIAVDKSPRTIMKMEYLERMYEMYPDASYLHLTRHPRSTGKSMLDLLARNDEWEGTFNPERIDAERVWHRTHKNVVEFAATLPEGQCMRIKGEELLSFPEIYLPQIAEWLDIRTDAEAIDAMMHPERSPYACMGPKNASYGNDPKFLESAVLRRGRVSEPSLTGELDWAPDRGFARETMKLAKEFGYS